MNPLWIAAAGTLAASAIPAVGQAQSWSGAAFTAGPAFTGDASGVTVHRGTGGFVGGHGDFGHGDRRHHDGRGRRGDAFVGGAWGYYDYQDRTFEPDSYNDWWHDRPDRAYPRWVRHNENCTEDRMWQGGGEWRCSW
jgi:hypothetical protein